MQNNYFWSKISDKIFTIIAYILFPITFPIHLYQMRKLDIKIKNEREEIERIKARNKLRT